MHKYFIYPLLLLSLLVNSCKTSEMTSQASDPQRVDDPSPGQPGQADTESGQQTTDPMKPDEYDTRSLASQMNEFSFELFKNISQDSPVQNLSFSPVSLNMAMAVVYSGAREETLNQTAEVFGFEKDLGLFHPAYHEYLSGLTQLAHDTLVDFNLANRVFLEETYPILQQYRQAVEKWHGGAFEKTDFVNNPRGAEKHINSWVEDVTRSRIRDIIPSGTLDALTRMVMVNAIYIKSDWKHPFEEHKTQEQRFTTIEGEEAMHDFMIQREDRIPHYESDDVKAIELPYTTPELSLLLIRPNAENIRDLSPYLPSQGKYMEIIEGLSTGDVHMEIPKFKVESEFALVDYLKQMGLQDIFDQRADLSGISGKRDLLVSAILQKVFFEMDEKGSEAAAATAVVVTTTAIMPDPEPQEPFRFIADRPFIFVLKENRYHTPLFVGQFVK